MPFDYEHQQNESRNCNCNYNNVDSIIKRRSFDHSFKSCNSTDICTKYDTEAAGRIKLIANSQQNASEY